MCGFVFLYQEDGSPEVLSELVIHATDLLSHRGPDDRGLWLAPPCFMGHRRLSIIDLEESKQPLHDPSGRFVLAYNGEIYNYKKLRKDLETKWVFKTSGDTEVVLAGLATYGAPFLSRMEGMWALALWDDHEKELLLSRHTIGKKPLFYQNKSKGIACASELTALANLSVSSWSEDIDSTADYLRYGYYLPGTTAYTGVFEVLPGHILKWSPRHGIHQSAYWSISLGGYSGTKEHARGRLRETLVCAVKRRLLADVEVGAFLSGGIDSSLIVSILSKELDTKLKTFTVGFTDRTYDESGHARVIAKECETDHFEKTFDTWDRVQLVSLVLDHVGQPFADASLLPTAVVSEFAARQVKVALSGDGADELFSGYQRYQARVLLRWYTRLPKAARRNIERVIREIPEPMSHHSHSILKKAHLFLDIVEQQKAGAPYIAPLLYSSLDFFKLAPDLRNRGHEAPNLPQESNRDSLLQMMSVDALVYLPQDILAKVDRASMAFSLEARAPFLDREVVELALSLPSHWHRRGTSGKRMLKETFFRLLPLQVWRRRKQGFVVPIHQWIGDELGSEILELCRKVKTPVESSQLRKMLTEHSMGRRDHAYRLWSIYIYLLWLQRRF